MAKIEGDQTVIRIIGRRKTGGITPGIISQEHMDWMDSMKKSIKLRVPKGIFRYKSHEEANADMERWLAKTLDNTEYDP